jgi:hypothetical protein
MGDDLQVLRSRGSTSGSDDIPACRATRDDHAGSVVDPDDRVPEGRQRTGDPGTHAPAAIAAWISSGSPVAGRPWWKATGLPSGATSSIAVGPSGLLRQLPEESREELHEAMPAVRGWPVHQRAATGDRGDAVLAAQLVRFR